MKRFILSSLCLLLALSCVIPVQAQTRYALTFPCQSSGTDNAPPIVAIQFDNPHSNGLPLWGPSGDGVTVIRRIKLTSGGQPGYYAQFWYTDNDSFEESKEFAGTHYGYYGFHPYPQAEPRTSDTDHYWEIAGDDGGDFTLNGEGNPITVVKGEWYVQALRVTRAGASDKTLVMYYNLPSVANADVITANFTFSNFGENDPPQQSPQLTIGDSPWFATYQHEKFCGQQGQIKIFDKVLSQADVLSEAANMNVLVTSEGMSNIWWGKKGFTSVDDLTCDYGTGRSWTWIDTSNKGTLGDAITSGGFGSGMMLRGVGSLNIFNWLETFWKWAFPHRPLLVAA